MFAIASELTGKKPTTSRFVAARSRSRRAGESHSEAEKHLQNALSSCKDDWDFAEMMYSYLASHTELLNNPKKLESIQRICAQMVPQDNDTPEARVAHLKSSPFFVVLDARNLEIFSQYFFVRNYTKEEVLFRQGDPGVAFFVIAEGGVNLFIENDVEGGRSQFLCSKQKGDMFGEAALKNDGKTPKIRSATVICAQPSVLLTITIDAYKEYVGNPKISAAAKAIVATIMETRIDRLVGKVGLFASLTSMQLQVLGNLFHYVTVDKGKVLIQEGDLGEDMYIVSHGTLSVKADSVQLARDIEEGEYFGEIALLMNLPRNATITATSDLLLLCLNKKAFEVFLELQPEARVMLSDVVTQRITHQFKKFQVPFFRAIPDDRYQEMSEMATLVEYQAGDIIFNQGDPATSFFLIAHGSLLVAATEGVPEEKPVDEKNENEIVHHEEEALTELHMLGPKQQPMSMHIPKSSSDADINPENSYHESLICRPRKNSLSHANGSTSLGGGKDILTTGGYFGEIALVVGMPRSATVRAISRCILLSFSKKAFDRVFADNDQAFAEFALRLAGESTPLRTFLMLPNARAHFQARLKKEFSEENLLFYMKAGEFAKLPAEERLEAARVLSDTFVKFGADQQVNLCTERRQAVMKAVGQGLVDVMTFEEAREDILTLMDLSIYTRYKTSPEFEELMSSLKSYKHGISDVRSHVKRMSTVTGLDADHRRNLTRISTHFKVKSLSLAPARSHDESEQTAGVAIQPNP